MESISISGEQYIKASSIARELGYTADYVGQLCRAKKVDAQLVGRSWYVHEDSIRAHKKNRYRSAAAKSKAEIRKKFSVGGEGDKEEIKPTLRKSSHFYDKLKNTVVSYEQDDADLIPILVESDYDDDNFTPIEVTHADAEKLKVDSEGDKYKITVSERPKFRFRGELSVSGEEDDDLVEDVKKEGAVHVKMVPKKVMLKRSGAIAMRRKNSPKEEEQTVPVSVRATPMLQPSRRYYLVVQFVTVLVLALTISIALLGTEGHTVVQNEAVTSKYSFNIGAAIESLKNGYK